MFESTEELAIHKLLLLYLLQQLNLPISNTKLTELVLENNYMDYFLLQQYISDLLQTELISLNKEKNKSSYIITTKGKKILEYFSNRIPEDLRSSIEEYVSKNKSIIKHAMDITAEYIAEKENEYIVHCKVKENNAVLIDLRVTVGSKEQAKIISTNFKKNAQKIYPTILNSLLNEN